MLGTPRAVASNSFETMNLKDSDLKNTTKGYVDNMKNQNQTVFKMEIIWFNVFVLTLVHLLGIYGVYLALTSANILTVIFCYVHGTIGGIGITAGAHRLWSHRSYKAKLPLRILLMLMQTQSLQTPIYNWVRDHRVHHKFTDTNADPHNSKRGFFFSHVGWLLVKKHPEVTKRGRSVDMSDILSDPVVTFQKKYYSVIGPFLSFVVPVLVPMYLWEETLYNAFFISFKRYAMLLNFTWLVNSAAHMWGYKPYDNRMSPTENSGVSFLAYGEGWHNYHHVYPWDYKAAELGNYQVNWSTAFIDFFASIGLAYDLKFATPKMVKKQAEKYGDGFWHETPMPIE